VALNTYWSYESGRRLTMQIESVSLTRSIRAGWVVVDRL